MNKRLLGIYLNDHLAGAVGGVELARRLLDKNRGTELEPDLGRILAEIEEDRAVLESLMDRLGVARNPVKTTGAWLLAQAGRLKLNGSPLGYSPLSRVEELEALAVGVEGKRSMWIALKRVRDQGVDFGVDLDDLAARAQRQRRVLERRRLEAVAGTFGG